MQHYHYQHPCSTFQFTSKVPSTTCYSFSSLAPRFSKETGGCKRPHVCYVKSCSKRRCLHQFKRWSWRGTLIRKRTTSHPGTHERKVSPANTCRALLSLGRLCNHQPLALTDNVKCTIMHHATRLFATTSIHVFFTFPPYCPYLHGTSSGCKQWTIQPASQHSCQ